MTEDNSKPYWPCVHSDNRMFSEYLYRHKYREEGNLLPTFLCNSTTLYESVFTARFTNSTVIRLFVHGYFVSISYFHNLNCVLMECGLRVEVIYTHFTAKIHCSDTEVLPNAFI
jgi:hypothetical protein